MIRTLLLSTALTGSLALFPVLAADRIVGLSPALAPETAKAELADILAFVVETTGPGEDALFVDAYAAKSICDFAVPDKASYRHPKAKLMANGPCVAKLMQFAENTGDNAGLPEGAMRLPQLARFLGENYPASKPMDVLVFGSVLHDDPKEPGTSMLRGHLPSDGYLNAAVGLSPYSTKAAAPLLANMRLHIATPGDGWTINGQHGEAVRRFWSLWIEGNGGALVTLSGDRQALFERVKSHAAPMPHAYALADTTKLEMIPTRRDLSERTPIYERRLSDIAPTAEEIAAAENIEVGIKWDCARCDLDIYARPYMGAETLFFGHTASREGQFFKDYVTAPEASEGLETIEFRAPVDLRKLVVAVNLFGGSPPGGRVTGELRIALSGRTYGLPFAIAAAEGNGGAGAADVFRTLQSPGAQWVVIDPLAVIKAAQ